MLLLQYTASLAGGSGQCGSYNALPHGLGAVGSGTPAIHYFTSSGQWALQGCAPASARRRLPARRLELWELWGIMGNYGELWQIVGNYGELWGIVWNYGELCGMMGKLWGIMGKDGE